VPTSYVDVTLFGHPAIKIVRREIADPPDTIYPEAVPHIPAAYLRWKTTGFGPHQFVNEYWLNEYNKNPSMDHLVVTMELVFGEDKSVLVATKPISVTSEATGRSFDYLGVLQDFPAISFTATMGSSTSSARSFSMAIPNEFVDALKLIRAGRMLAGLAEVSIQVDGGDYDERYVIMRGSMDSGVTFGDTKGEMLEVSIVDPKEILSMDLPPYKVPDSWPFSGDTVYPFFFRQPMQGVPPSAVSPVRDLGGYSGRGFPPSSGVGKTYPIVWGHWSRTPCVPLVRDPHASTSSFGSDADLEYESILGLEEGQDRSSFWVVAYGHGHRFMCTNSLAGRAYLTVPQLSANFKETTGEEWLEATSGPHPPSGTFMPFGFFIDDEFKASWRLGGGMGSSASSYMPWRTSCALMEVSDPFGVPVTVLKMNAVTETFDYGEAITIPMISSVGASIDPSVGSLWNGHSIINCVRFFAKAFTTLGESGIDDSLFAKAESRLGSLNVRGLINGSGEATQAQTLTWIENELLKAFPMVSMTFTGQGYGPVVIDRREVISGEYTVGQWGITSRVSSIQETPKSELFNEFMINYAYHEGNASPYDGTATDAGFTASARRNAGNSIACQISEAQGGKHVAPVIETIFIHDMGVAEYCIDWLCEHQTLPSYYVEYAADVWMMFKHGVGDNIKLTDERLGFDAVVSSITKIEYVDDHVVLGLRVWERYYTIGGAATNYPEPNFDPSPDGSEPQP
tara:strand:- start:61 stop:2274 length:2214 start_codon:yes stop_codon:yes gene_type:complete